MICKADTELARSQTLADLSREYVENLGIFETCVQSILLLSIPVKKNLGCFKQEARDVKRTTASNMKVDHVTYPCEDQ